MFLLSGVRHCPQVIGSPEVWAVVVGLLWHTAWLFCQAARQATLGRGCHVEPICSGRVAIHTLRVRPSQIMDWKINYTHQCSGKGPFHHENSEFTKPRSATWMLLPQKQIASGLIVLVCRLLCLQDLAFLLPVMFQNANLPAADSDSDCDWPGQ